ncbi:MAG: protein tyrosine phosphatase (PTP) superfamily phosphohydrolase (DUF442 family) [Bacteriovoracaceae bacterium]|jgi:protein tyrosine phosphatase (PTP) superfamily phosphohydrolase (DUF442 family)
MSCAQHEPKNMPNESNVEIVEGLIGNRWANIYFSSQPNTEQMKRLKKSGFASVVNLRQKSEKGYNESREAKVLQNEGLHYYNIPLTMKTELNDEFIDSITSKVVKHRAEGKVLIHCSSGNRVALWLGAHFKKDHSFTDELSLNLSKSLGLTNTEAQERLETYLRTGK